MVKTSLLILDISDNSAAGLFCDVDRRAFVPAAAHFCAAADGADLHGAVGEVIEKCGAAGARCYLSLPASEFSFKNILLPFSDTAKINEVLRFELQDRLSSSVEPFIYDFTTATQTDGQTQVLAAVISGPRLEGWLNLLNSHSLDPEIVTISGAPLLQQLCRSSLQGCERLVYLDLAHTEATFFFSVNGVIQTIRPLIVLPWDGLNSTGADQLARWLQMLGEEIRRTLLALDVDPQPGGGLHWAIGGGIGSRPEVVMHFENVFAASFSVPRIAVPDSSILQPDGVLPQEAAQKLFGALTMDVRPHAKNKQLLNLRRSESAAHSARDIITRLARLSAALALVLIIAAGYQVYDFRRMARELDGLADQAQAIFMATLDGARPVADPVLELGAKINQMKKTMVVDTVHHPDKTAVALLSDVSGRIPPAVNVSFERFTFDRQRVTIDGITDTFNDVDKISSSLEASAHYSAVSIGSAVISGNGSEVSFSLTLQL